MNYLLLLIILIVLLIISFKLLKIDAFNPIMIAILCYMVGLLFCIIMIPVWKYEITFKSIVVVSSTFVFLILTSLLGQVLSKKVKLKYYNNSIICLKEYTLSKKIILGLVILLFSISIIKNYIDIAYEFGFNGIWYEFTELSLAVKKACINEGAALLRVNTYMQYFLKGITYCSLFLFIYNVVRLKDDIKKNLYFLLLSFPYLLVIYVSGWRTDFIFVFVYILMIFGFNIDRTNNSLKSVFRCLTVMFLMFAIVLIIWSITAYLRSKGEYDYNAILRYVATYFGGGIVNFDQYINGFIEFPKSNIFGNRVFVNIYSYLNRLHIGNFNIFSTFLPFDNVINTNVYSGFFRAYDDFGFLGNGLYLGFIFFIYSFIYSLVNKYKNLFFVSILDAYFSYPVCLMAVDEAFSIFFISTTPIYIILFYGIVYYFMIYHDNKGRLHKK